MKHQRLILAFNSLLVAGLLSGCATSKCKTIDDKGSLKTGPDVAIVEAERKAQQEKAAAAALLAKESTAEAQTSDGSAPQPSPEAGGTQTSSPDTTATGPSSVHVYKYDNSRQCGQGSKAISLEEMAKQLKNIKIISQSKKNDGMMRIQMCGAPTGEANVYEIDQKDLKKAVKLGFREWKYSL